MAFHLNPATDVAERVLLPGDPQRALAIAQALLDKPSMLNTARGLWGYTGRAPHGEVVTVQATGMGGPSAAIVAEELIELGARTLIRIGTCGSLATELRLGQLAAVRDAIPYDGTSRALGADGRVAADPELTQALIEAAGARPVTAVSTDLFYDPREGLHDGWRAQGAEAVEMEAATILAIARFRGLRAACLLAVTDLLPQTGGRVRLERERIADLGVQLGGAALRALAQVTTR
jgi:DeoD family purine-nucleoside phosphorylase